MTKYKCGHKMNTIITNNDILTLSAYISWKNSVGFDGDKSQCWNCFCDADNKREGI